MFFFLLFFLSSSGSRQFVVTVAFSNRAARQVLAVMVSKTHILILAEKSFASFKFVPFSDL
jgi:hypothetical protein